MIYDNFAFFRTKLIFLWKIEKLKKVIFLVLIKALYKLWVITAWIRDRLEARCGKVMNSQAFKLEIVLNGLFTAAWRDERLVMATNLYILWRQRFEIVLLILIVFTHLSTSSNLFYKLR